MGTLTDRLALLITADAAQAIGEIKKVGSQAEKDLGKATSGMDKFGSTATKVGAGMVGFSAVAGAGLVKAAQASEEAHRSQLLLQNTLANMPKLAGQSSKAFNDQANALQQVTAADGDAIVAAQAMLGTFNLTGQQIRGVTPLVVDYARKFGVDLTGAAIQVGKALDGNSGALKRNGVSIDETLFKTDRYTAVTQALRNQVGGFAEAEGKTFSGQLAILKNNLGDVEEAIGSGVVSALNSAIGPISHLAAEFKNLDPSIQSNIGKFLTIGTAAIGAIGSLSLMAGTVAKMRSTFTDSAGALNNFGKAAAGLGAVAGVGAAIVGVQALGKVLDDLLNNTDMEALTRSLLDMANGVDSAGQKFTANTKSVSEFIRLFNAPGTDRRVLKSVIDDTDKALAALVTGGAPENARKAVEALAKQMGITPEQVLPFLNDYREALDKSKTAAAVAGAANKEAADGQNDVADSAADAKTKVDAEAKSLAAYGTALNGVTDAQKSRVEAARSVERSQRDEATANKELSDLLAKGAVDANKVADANKRIADTAKATTDAQKAEAQSAKHVADAQQSVVDADLALQKVKQGASAEEIAKAALARDKALRDQKRAAFEVADAEDKKNSIVDIGVIGVGQSVGTVRDKERAELDLADALDGVKEADFNAQDAQKTLDDTRNKGKEGSEDLKKAQDDLKQKQDDLNQAIEDQATAHQHVIDAQADEVAAHDDLVKAEAGDPDFADKVAKARQGVADAHQNTADAINNEKDAIDGLIQKQKDLAAFVASPEGQKTNVQTAAIGDQDFRPVSRSVTQVSQTNVTVHTAADPNATTRAINQYAARNGGKPRGGLNGG